MSGIFDGFIFKPAPDHEIQQAKIFGKKVVGEDGGRKITTYHWNGKIYVVDEE